MFKFNKYYSFKLFLFLECFEISSSTIGSSDPFLASSTLSPAFNKMVDNQNAIFRNSDQDFLEKSVLSLDPSIYKTNNDEINDILDPLLPPQINYDKVNKYVNKFGTDNNDTSDFFKTFYFHPSFGNIMLLIGLAAFTLWVLVMNILVVCGIWRTHRTGHMTDFYLTNLALCDTILGVLILPLMDTVILIGYFPFSRFVCDTWVFLDYYLIVAASFGSCAMMCNYLWMMKWPESYPVDAKHHILTILFCWIAVNFSWTPSFFIDRLSTFYPQGQCGFSISRNQYFSFYIGISGFYIPLLVCLICAIWSLYSLKNMSGILSWRQSLSIGRRKRSSKVNEVIWTMFKILPAPIIGSVEVPDLKEQNEKKTKKKVRWSLRKLFCGSGDGENGEQNSKQPKFFGPGAEDEEKNKKRPKLKDMKHKQSIDLKHFRRTDPKMIAQMAKDHYPLVVSSLVLFIVCRSLFYIYFGVGSFVPNFFPLDLSNGVYWLMHSNAAISPIIHLAFDPELRVEIRNMLGFRRNPQASSIIEPEIVSPSFRVTVPPTITRIESIKNSLNNMSKESIPSNLSHSVEASTKSILKNTETRQFTTVDVDLNNKSKILDRLPIDDKYNVVNNGIKN